MASALHNPDLPRLLLLDTCGEEASLALAAGEGIVAETRIAGRSSSERLLPALREMLGRAGWELSQLAAISVVHGPGSFTGVRVGLSAAKGLAEGSGRPLLVLSRLEVLAELGVPLHTGAAIVALPAGRNEVFRATLQQGRAHDPRLESVEGLLASARAAGAAIICEEPLAAMLAGARIHGVPLLSAADGLRLALAQWQSRSFTDPAAADAAYLRRTEQEMLERQAAHRERKQDAARGLG